MEGGAEGHVFRRMVDSFVGESVKALWKTKKDSL